MFKATVTIDHEERTADASFSTANHDQPYCLTLRYDAGYYDQLHPFVVIDNAGGDVVCYETWEDSVAYFRQCVGAYIRNGLDV